VSGSATRIMLIFQCLGQYLLADGKIVVFDGAARPKR
jgi:hypothetical protein